MSFKEKFKTPGEIFSISQEVQEEIQEDFKHVPINEARDFNQAQDVLRNLGFKIKLEVKTKFGTQIDFSKKYSSKEIKSALKEFKYEFTDGGETIFVTK